MSVESSVGMLDVRPCKAVATANVASLSGTTTIDGVALSAGDRVLLTAQTTGSQNGPWTVQSGAWTRPLTYPSGGLMTGGLCPVTGGSANAGTLWTLKTTGSVTVDTDSAAWSQIAAGSGGGGFTAVAAKAYRNAAFSLPASAFTKVPVDTLSFDTAANMDVTTNHRFTAPATGYYSVAGQLNISSPVSAAAYMVLIYKNGTEASRGELSYPASGSLVCVVVSDHLQLSSGDYLELYGYNSSGSSTALNVGNSAFSCFSVARVG